MDIACEKCGTSYVVEEARIPPSGLKMKCTVCFNRFTVLPANAEAPQGADQQGQGHGGQMPDLTGQAMAPPAGQPAPLVPPPLASGGPRSVPPPLMNMQPGRGGESAELPAPILPPPPPGMDIRPGRGGQSAELPAPVVPPPVMSTQPGYGRQSGQAPPPVVPPPVMNMQPGRGGQSAELPAPVVPPPIMNMQPGRGDQSAELPTPLGPSPYEPADLPAPARRQGLPGDGGIDLPGLPQSRGGQPPGAGAVPRPIPPPLADMPLSGNTVLGLGRPSPVGVAPNLGDLPGEPQNAPGGVNIDLSDFDLSAQSAGGAGFTDLPAPKGGPDLPGPPTGLADLPAPVGVKDLPAPVPGAVDLPAPAGPVPSGPAGNIVDLPAPSPGIDLPQPVSEAGSVNYGNFALNDDAADDLDLGELPMQAGHRGGATVMPPPTIPVSPPQHGGPVASATDGGVELPPGILDVRAPLLNEPPVADISVPGATVVPHEPSPSVPELVAPPPTSAPAHGRIAQLVARVRGSTPLLVGVSVGAFVLVAGLVLGLVTDYGFFGFKLLGSDSGESSEVQGEIKAGRRLLVQDTPKAYKQAEEHFTAAGEDAEDAKALVAQAQLARIVRFGPEPSVRQKAEQLLTELAEDADEDDPPGIELLKARGLLHLTQPTTAKKGVDLLKQATARAPKDATAATYLGWGNLQTKQFREAMSAFGSALALDNEVVAALFGMAKAKAQAGKTAAALEWTHKVIRANPKHGSARLLRARLFHGASQPGKAQADAKILLEAGDSLSPYELSEVHAFVAGLRQERGLITEARRQYDEALKLNSKNPAAHLGVAKLLLRAKQYGKAASHFKTVRKIDPENVEAVVLLARAELALGKPLDARQALQEVAKQAPSNARVRFVLGQVDESVGDLDGAIKLYTEAIRLDGEYFEPYLHLSRIYLRKKKKKLAFTTLKQASALIPGARTRNAMGEAHRAAGALKRARAEFRRALELDPRLNVALFNLAATLSDQRKPEEALRRYEELQQRDQDYPGLATNLARLYVKLGRHDEATASFTRALETESPSIRLRLDASRAYVVAGEFKRAIAQADAVLKTQHRLPEALALRAEANLGAGELGNALVDIRQAIEGGPTANYYAVKAHIQEALHRGLDALDSYKKAADLEPKRTDLRLEQARLLVRAGTVKDALKELKRLIRTDPSIARAYLYQGIALADLGQEKRAVASIRTALKKDPTLGEAHLRLGQFLYDENKITRAQTHLHSAIKLASDRDFWRADAHFLVGQIAMKRRLRKQATEAFQTFLKLVSKKDARRIEARKALKELGVVQAPE